MGIRKCYPFVVGDVVIAKDDNNVRHMILSIGSDGEPVVHKCLRSGTLYESSYLTFPTKFVKQKS